MAIDLDCEQIRRALGEFLEDEIPPDTRAVVEAHLQRCRQCRAVNDGIRNLVRLMADERVLEVPLGFDQRLHRRLTKSNSATHPSARSI